MQEIGVGIKGIESRERPRASRERFVVDVDR
jgi:hypothetical protein